MTRRPAALWSSRVAARATGRPPVFRHPYAAVDGPAVVHVLPEDGGGLAAADVPGHANSPPFQQPGPVGGLVPFIESHGRAPRHIAHGSVRVTSSKKGTGPVEPASPPPSVRFRLHRAQRDSLPGSDRSISYAWRKLKGRRVPRRMSRVFPDNEPALFANTAREQYGLNTNPWGRRSGTDQASPVHGDTAPILADGYPVRPPPRILPRQASMAARQVSPNFSRILRE